MTSSIYLKANKVYNNVFSEDGKILKVGRSPKVSLSLPHLPPPPDSFFQLGQKHTISNFRGGILTGGAYASPVLKKGVHMHTLPHGCARLWRKINIATYLFQIKFLTGAEQQVMLNNISRGVTKCKILLVIDWKVVFLYSKNICFYQLPL